MSLMNSPAKRFQLLPIGKYFLKSSLLALAYFGIAKWTLSQVFQVSGGTVVPVWPASGLAVGVLAAYGYRFLPGVVAGSILLSWPIVPHTLLSIAGTSAEALVGAFLLRSLLHGERWLTRIRDLVGLALAAIGSSAVAAFFGVTTRLMVGAIAWGQFGGVWLDYWLGDVLGIIMVAPLILTLAGRGRDLPRLREFQDVVAIAVALTVFSLVVFYDLLPVRTSVPLLGGFFPLLLWMVFRGGPLGASVGMLIISSLSLGGTAHGHGPFASQSLSQGLHEQGMFIGVLMCTAFLFAAVLEGRREAEDAVVEKEASLRAFYDSAPFLLGIIELRDDNAIFVSCNRAVTHFVDRPLQRTVNVPLSELREAGLDVETWVEHCRESAASGEARRFEITRETPQGRRVLSAVVAAIQPQPADYPRFSFVMEDVTERTELERERERLFRNALDMLCIVSFDGSVKRANPAYCRALGFSESEVREMAFDAFLHPDDVRASQEVLAKLHRGLDVGSFETRLRRKNGEYIWALWAWTPDRSRRVIYCTGKDITEKREAENALRTAKDTADENVKAKSQFLANVTHELRTPLSGIIGMARLLRATPLNRQQVEYVDAVTHSGDSLMTLVNDLLDFSKIEARKLRMELESFSLRSVIGRTMKTLAPHAHEKGLELAYHVLPKVPDALNGDPGRLRQVLVNLVANAIKFTDAGEVVVRVSLDERTTNQDPRLAVHFEVSDTGIGIPQSQQANIFQAFVQADGSTTRQYGGTGLGLAISRQLVDLMGGKIWAQSEPDKGSTFHFTSLLWPQEGRPSCFHEPAPSQLEPLRVLVLDDSTTVREILEALLQEWRMEPTMVADAEAALAAVARAYAEDEPFDLFLLDADPRGDIGRLLERIRNEAKVKIPCIAMVATKASVEPPDTSRLALVARLTKPIQPSHLKRAIELLLAGHAIESEDVVTTGAFDRVPRTSSLRVLLAEDDPVNRAVALRILENAGHEVRAVENGRQAVEAYEDEQFDVILMDVQMPELDGMEATKVIRTAERGTKRRTPIVALTAHALDENKEECRLAGMDDFVSKPVDPEALCDLLDALDPATETTTPPTKVAKSSAHDVPVFDREALLRRTEGDRSLAAELIAIFLEDCSPTLKELEQHVVARDAEQIQRLVHRFAGSLEAIEARSSATAAKGLRDAALAGSTELEPLLEIVRCELDKLKSELNAQAKENAVQ